MSSPGGDLIAKMIEGYKKTINESDRRHFSTLQVAKFILDFSDRSCYLCSAAGLIGES